MPKNKPNIGDSNWGVTLNQHLEQMMAAGGGINFANSDPTSLSSGDDGYTFINTSSKELKRWTGTSFVTLLSGTPSGVISSFGGLVAPTGWSICDGSAISRTTFSDLFSVIGTAYGIGDGSTTFNLPDIRGRIPVGTATSSNPVITVSSNASSGATTINLQSVRPIFLARGTKITFASGPTGTYTIANISGIEVGTSATVINLVSAINSNLTSSTVVDLVDGGISGKNLGTIGGTEQQTIGISELPNHFHNTPYSTVSGTDPIALSGSLPGVGNIQSSVTGNGIPLNNLQPFIVVNYIIKT
jgi:microcystin-dependent protein